MYIERCKHGLGRGLCKPTTETWQGGTFLLYDVRVASGTNAAEQYTRATYNGNMSGVVVHFYVWDTEIWQNLREDERG